jgi:hypothetical protein
MCCPAIGLSETRQAMIKKQTVVAELRRDASFVGNAVVVILFMAFIGLAITAALFDFVSFHH